MKRIKLFLTAVMVLLSTAALAQTQVTGVVTDAGTGEALAGAAVQVKGTMTGASAGTDGSYSVRVADPKNAVLIFSFYGYKALEVPVGGRSIVNVELETDATVLEDVVVVAYGTQKREAVTGSVSSVKGDVISAQPVTSVDRALAGKLAGVSISSFSGQPGATTQIRIRGNGSINASNAPLWVVDGIPVFSGNMSSMTTINNVLTGLNPNDIESITILKDAAAASAYGSRAANGVVLVTTKSGKEGKAQFSARAKWGVSWLNPDTDFRMMTASELLGYQRQAIFNAGEDPDNPASESYYRPMSLLNNKLYNPLHEFTRMGNTQEYEIGAQGGNSRAKYFSSFSYQKDNGIVHSVTFQKLQGRINASYKLLDNLETGVRFNMAYTNQRDVPLADLQYANPLWSGEQMLPWWRLQDDEGNYVSFPDVNSGENPRAVAMYDDTHDTAFHLNTTVNLKWSPIKNLDVETRNSIESVFRTGKLYYSPGGHANAYCDQLETTSAQIHQITTSNTITYSNIFGGYHSVRALVGQEASRYINNSTAAYSPKVDPAMPYHNTADQTTTEISEGHSRENMLSFFAIADYNYDNRYFAQATFREDGSSLFGADNKWGAFWSVSASWNATNEKFLKNVSWLNLLKLRVSYGVNGNNGISPYQAFGLYGTATYNGLTGYLPSQLENKVLSWEKNKTVNGGIDFAFLRNRISGSIDVYTRKTVDLLLTKQIPQTTGFSTIFSNVGSMKNSGVELQLDYNIIQNSDMLWSVGGNIAYNKTTILDLGGDEFIGTNSRQVVGKGMYTWYLYDYYGVNPTNGEALWVASVDEKTGEKTLTNDASKARRYYAGSPDPKFIGGFNTQFSWKGISLSAFFEFKAGQKVLLLNEHYYLNSDGAYMTMNQFASELNYWKQPGDIGVEPKPVAGNTSNSNQAWSTRWMENGSYLRFKDITLSYTFPQALTRKIKINNLRVYVSGLNLYCFNDVNFWDPEQGVTGITYGEYPNTKAFVGGLEITF